MSKPAVAASRKGKPLPGQEWLKRRVGSQEWQIDFTVEGHRFRASSGTSDLAKASALAAIEHDRLWRQIKLGETAEQHLTLNDAFVRYYDEVAKATEYGQNSQRYQMNNILRLTPRGMRLADLSDPAINDLVVQLKRFEILPKSGKRREGAEPRYLSGATINRVLATLAAICKHARKKWGVEVGAWEPPEHRLQESRGREVFLDKGQARRLMAEACGHLQPILLLELCTGLRKTNLLEIQWEHLSLELGTAVMIQKGDKPLAIGLPDVAIALLGRIEPDVTKRKGPVFWFGNPTAKCACPRCADRGEKRSLHFGEPIRSVKRAFAAAASRAGVLDMPNGRLRFHDLRHTFASFLLEESGDLMVVRDALGHSDIATTQRYAHLLPGRKRQAINGAVAGLEGPPALADERKKA